MLKEITAFVKEHCDGFLVVNKLQEHYTGASHRIFICVDLVPVLIYWFEDKQTFTCKSCTFLNKIKSTELEKFLSQ